MAGQIRAEQGESMEGDDGVAFSYARFWDWWRNDEGGVLQATDDIIVRVCDADYRAMKYRKGVAAPFLTRNMAAFRVTDPSLLSRELDARDDMFGNGLFMVMERDALLSDAMRDRLPPDSRSARGPAEKARDQERAVRNKCLYAVCPLLHERGAPDGGPLLAGDHFTFVVGSSAKSLHLHLTEYVPYTGRRSAAGVQGRTSHTDNHLPLEFRVPRDVEAFKNALLEPELRADEVAVPLHRLLLRPSGLYGGGGHGAGRRRARRHARAREPGSRRAFDDLWYELPLRRLVVVGARRGGGYDFIVAIHDRLAHEPGVLRRSAAFRLPVVEAAWDDDGVYEATASAMAHLTWASFVDPPPMPGDAAPARHAKNA